MTADNSRDDNTRSFIALAKGTMVSHYRIIEKIGAGGMGEVYLAEDTRLNRKVALKSLPAHLCEDEDCRKRFTREAQAAAGLDHPNIAGIYEVGEYHGRPFYSMQVVEGQSLKDIIAGKDLPIDRILEIAIQVCEGLQAAHEKGIIHRDIKPSNILLDTHGRVRIVDFGLAAIRGSESLTKSGSTLGTIGYMSPEQVQGKDVDQRSDLFSLGVVLYEMITARSPFSGDNEAEILHNICYQEPEPLSRYKSGISGELQRIVTKALAKDRAVRYQHIDDLLSDLMMEKSILSGMTPAPGKAPGSAKRRFPALAASVILIVAIIAAYFLFFSKEEKPAAATQRQITMLGNVAKCEISPDGSQVAFIIRQKSWGKIVMVQDLSGGEPLSLLQGNDITDIKWSPDGKQLALTGWIGDKMGVFIIPRLGGALKEFTVGNGSGSEEVAWTPNGQLLLYHQNISEIDKFYLIDIASGDMSSFAVLNVPDFQWTNNLQCLPDSRHFIFRNVGDQGNSIWLGTIGDSDAIQLLSGVKEHYIWCQWSPVEDAIYYLAKRAGRSGFYLVCQDIDLNSGKPKGKPKELMPGLNSTVYMSMAGDGRKCAYLSSFLMSNIWRAKKNEKQQWGYEQLTKGTAYIEKAEILPDGQQLVFSAETQNGFNIFTMPLEGGSRKQLTFSGSARMPVWSPDGKRIALTSLDSGRYTLSVIDLEAGSVKNFSDAMQSEEDMDKTWASGKRILYQRPGSRNFYLLDIETGAEEPLVDNDSVGWMFYPHFSPDKNWLAIYWNRVDYKDGEKVWNPGVWVISMLDRTQHYVCEAFLSEVIGWSPDSKWIFYHKYDGGTILRVNINDKLIDTVLVHSFESDYELPVSVAKAGKDFIFTVPERRSDVWVAENFDPDVK